MTTRIRVTADDIKQYIFGVSDGLTSALGVVIPLAVAGRPMFTVAFGLAICAAIGMGGGEYLSDKTGRLRSAAMMAIASFLGTLIPAVPFLLLPYGPATAIAVLLCLLTAVIISEAKSRTMTRLRAYTQTVTVLLTASVSTTAFAFLTN